MKKELPEVKPFLDSYDFPHEILQESQLTKTLDESRLRRIRESVADTSCNNSMIRYVVPWFDSEVIEPGTVDMIVSQAVLEHVNDLEMTYDALYHWLGPAGFVSHQIDFKSHGTSRVWNGHWTYSDLVWRLIVGKRPYVINRQPLSRHLYLLDNAGFHITNQQRYTSSSTITHDQLAPSFQTHSAEDLLTAGLFVQASVVE